MYAHAVVRLLAFTVYVALSLAIGPAIAEELSEPVDVSFTAKVDGTEQKYVLQFPPEFNADQPHSLMIALHGHGADRWQFVRHDRGECLGARVVAAKYRMIYLSPDYRAKTSWMGPAAEADLLQIIVELKAKYQIDKIIIMGGSMGGSSALTFTALHPELIDGVVSLNGTANHLEYAKFQQFIATSFGGRKNEIPDEYKRRSAEYWPERFTMPIAMTTGGKDELVPPDSCQRLAGVLRNLKRDCFLIHRPSGGHATNLEDTTAALEYVCQRVLVEDEDR